MHILYNIIFLHFSILANPAGWRFVARPAVVLRLNRRVVDAAEWISSKSGGGGGDGVLSAGTEIERRWQKFYCNLFSPGVPVTMSSRADNRIFSIPVSLERAHPFLAGQPAGMMRVCPSVHQSISYSHLHFTPADPRLNDGIDVVYLTRNRRSHVFHGTDHILYSVCEAILLAFIVRHRANHDSKFIWLLGYARSDKAAYIYATSCKRFLKIQTSEFVDLSVPK